jgi:hypothetical protein
MLRVPSGITRITERNCGAGRSPQFSKGSVKLYGCTQVLSRERGARVAVFLTSVGGGAFGNRSLWIIEALGSAAPLYDSTLTVRGKPTG